MFSNPWVVLGVLVISVIGYGIYAYLDRDNQDWYWSRKESTERLKQEEWVRNLVHEAQKSRKS